MHFTFSNLALALSLSSICLAQQTCPAIPDTGVEIGEPVPIKPEDIPKGCSPFEILVARGTSEPSFPKYGVIVGDPVVSNASARLSGVQGYPVQYPASSQILTGGQQGTDDIVRRLTSQSTLCPNQTFALVGYSQGASIMHRASDKLPASVLPKIKAVVMFGDPYNKLGLLGQFRYPLRSRALGICAAGDPVCDSGSCQYFHLTYIRPEYIDKAVDFIVKGFKG